MKQSPFPKSISARQRTVSSAALSSWILTLAACAFLLPSLVRGQGSPAPFTYQGRLDNQNSPYNGTVTMQLSLWGFATGGTAIRTETISNVGVINGLFTATPTTFSPSDFGTTTSGDWLQISVSTDGGANYNTLTPRQRITYAPLALNAERAKTISGTISGSQISGNGTLSPSALGTGTTTGTITFNPSSGAPFLIPNAASPVVTNLNADKLDGLDSLSFLRTTGGSLTGTLSLQNQATVDFSNTLRQSINLYFAVYGIGVQNDTLYQRSGNDFSWFRGGAHNDLRNNPGGGTEMMRLSDSALWLRPGTTALPRGRLLFGDLNGSLPYAAIGEAADDDDVLEITGEKVRIRSNNSGNVPTLNFGATTGQLIELFQNASDTYGIGVQSSTQYFRTGNQFAWFKGGGHSNTAGDPGSGGLLLATLDSAGTLQPKSLFTTGSVAGSFLYSTGDAQADGELTVGGNAFLDGQVMSTGTVAGFATRNRGDQSKIWTMYSRTSGTTDQLAFYSSNTNRDVAAFSPNGDFYLVGALSTTVLTIRGGADVAEPFEMTNADELEAGSVVVIDEMNPGKLRLSTEAYDTRVAGIVSGAGGVKPGLRLHQDGVMEGDHHVALSGRVYVKADAVNGAIRPGDLLTTCENPGHAARVENSAEAQGAILGKAMSKLDRGTGLVLVLVTLQ